MNIERMKTQATVVKVRTDRGAPTVDATIPALKSNKDFMYLKWRGAGSTPSEGTEVLLEINPVRRSSYYIGQGTLSDGPVDGSEAPWQVDWEVLSWEPLSPRNADAPKAPSTQQPVAFLDANKRYRSDMEGVNDRKAVSDCLALVEPGMYTLDGLIADAEKLADWYNKRNAVRLQDGLIADAQESGAVISKVVDESEETAPGVPLIKNQAELKTWVGKNGWDSQVGGILKKEGYESSAEYLKSHSVQGLAELIAGNASW